jgi:hypothetical protein
MATVAELKNNIENIISRFDRHEISHNELIVKVDKLQVESTENRGRAANMEKQLGLLYDKFSGYVTIPEFSPVRAIAYGAASIILVAVMAAVVKLVIF